MGVCRCGFGQHALLDVTLSFQAQVTPDMEHSSTPSHLSRRRFLAAAGLTLVAPALLSSCASGRSGRPAPSERITMGIVGWGMMGPHNTKAFLSQKDCQVVAACDVDQDHLEQALTTINSHYGNKDCRGFHDYRELMARQDVDTVMLAVPDHWHALTATAAAAQQKGHLRRKAPGPHHRRAAGHCESRPASTGAFGKPVPGSDQKLISARRPKSCEAGSSEK